MEIEEYAKQFEYVVCSKADALAEGIRIGLKAAKIVGMAAVDKYEFGRDIDRVLAGDQDLPEVGE